MFQYSVMVIFPWFLLALNVCGCILQNLFKKYISQGRHQMSPQVSSGRYTIDFDESDHRSRGVVSSGVGSISWNEGVQDCAQTSYQEQLWKWFQTSPCRISLLGLQYWTCPLLKLIYRVTQNYGHLKSMFWILITLYQFELSRQKQNKYLHFSCSYIRANFLFWNQFVVKSHGMWNVRLKQL